MEQSYKIKILMIVLSLSVQIMLLYPFKAMAAQEMYDPIFGIRYDPKVVVFESAPPLVTKYCEQLAERKLWIYGKLESHGSIYFILSGFLKIKPDTNSRVPSSIEPDLIGVVAKIEGKECVLGDPMTVMNGRQGKSKVQKKHIKLNKDELSQLSSDILKRYTKAFGSKKLFLKALDFDKIDRSSLPIALREILENMENRGQRPIKSNK